jgi:hypothetical protein
MTQTMYAHVNKWTTTTKKKHSNITQLTRNILRWIKEDGKEHRLEITRKNRYNTKTGINI